ncbi:MAG: 30S ribosomal protein S20 [Chlamydiota bacterium]
MSNEEQPKKTKLATAKKRDQQNSKKNIQNRSFKAKTRTTVTRFEQALEAKSAVSELQTKLFAIYSMMDKAVKKGIFKKNKAARLKSRYASRIPS